MSLTNPKTVVTEERLTEFYQSIFPYLGGIPEVLANKFEKANLYSTDEKIIGCWTDGKPLYQKTLVFGYSLTDTETQQEWLEPVGAPIDRVVRIWGNMYNNSQSSNWASCLPYYAGDNSQTYAIIGAYTDYTTDTSKKNKVGIYWRGTCAWITDPIITVQYTKTTDAANSFKYGTDTDYSTTEKIIGTWIDGRPLYQKVITDTMPAAGEQKYVSTGASIDFAICDVVVVTADGTAIQNLSTMRVSSEMTLNWSLRFAVCPYNHSTYPNCVLLENLNGAGYVNASAYIILRYTKTTD